ncbi:MAG: class I SAM-dependent methyltransferase family protein [Candidatus Methanofastidiosia archaeon]|jgi:tRNA (guanine37-N1)-methyltransferase
MHAVKVPKQEGEKIRRILVENKVLLPEYKVDHDKKYIYFPVKSGAGIPGYKTVEHSFQKREHPPSLDTFDIRSLDIIGDIAVIDIPEEAPHKNDIAKALLARKPIKTVVEKSSKVQGEHRTRELTHIMGEQKFETVHKEYGLLYKVNIDTVYFNPRLATERMRITKMVTPGEVVADMFCGVGPFSLLISKFSKAETIYAIDINPHAIALLKENITLNHCDNVIPILGDSKEKIKTVGHVNRIIMNLPHSAFEFLPVALPCGDIIHYYRITSDIQGEIDNIRLLSGKMGTNIDIIDWSVVKSYSPDMEMYRVDIGQLKKVN